MSDDDVRLPPVLYAPCERSATPGESTVNVEFHQTTDQRVALLVYSALDRLINACGDSQPWALFQTDHLQDLYEAQPFDVLLLDEPLPAELRRQGAS